MTATWLSPIFKSPMADNGYDISNFTDIDPIFGTLGDFDLMMKKAKEIGIKIILDFVPNHSSDECEWFQKSINREDGYDDFYIWADGKDDPENPGKKLPPSNWVSVFGGSMWTWNEKRQQFYLHQFMDQQPDFNFRNPKVRVAMLEVLKFWLDRGVAGFRIDAVPHMFENINEDGTFPDEDPNIHVETQDQYETVELLYEWRAFLESYQKQNGGDTRILLAEAYSSLEMLDKYFGNGTHFGAQIPFNFALWGLDNTTNARDAQKMADGWMNVMWKKHKTANWVTGNHDMGRIVDRIGQNKKHLAHFLLTGLPGVTITYYGEEIGMSNVITCTNCTYSESRSYSRSPFQWTDEVSAGFSSSNETWLPVAEDYKIVNVKEQRKHPRSTLNIFKALQKLKNTPAFKAFKDKNGFSYKPVNDNVFQIIRRNKHEEYRFLMNFGDKVEKVGKLISSWFNKNELVEYTVVSEKSHHHIGDKVKLGKVTLMPVEGIVLKRVYKH
ncbi:maltase A2-like [Episyrphus balteatus]|uniref:maltase A2-like n=1 Tax=Episyrphus balteatus TaxID=286459 RepID=UPI0024865183|nr:maltase A2-like [Episyrphus balteatus]